MVTYKMSKRMYNFIKFPRRKKDKPLSKKEIINSLYKNRINPKHHTYI